jgi:hypothetical protein
MELRPKRRLLLLLLGEEAEEAAVAEGGVEAKLNKYLHYHYLD